MKNMKILKYIGFILLSMTVFGCKHKESHEEQKELHDSEHANVVEFDKDQRVKMGVAIEQLTKAPFGQVVKVAAQIMSAQGDEQMVVAKTSGIVDFTSANCVVGSSVRAGQTLCSVSGDNMADNNLAVRYQEARSEYERTKSEYERQKNLVADKIVSETEFSRTKTAFINAEANYRNMQKNFSSGRQRITSPISGFVKQVLVKNGEYVAMGQTIAIVSQNRSLFVKAEIQPKYYASLNESVTANIKTSDNDKVFTLKELNGKMISYGKSLNVENPLIPIIFQIDNKAGMLPGSIVQLYIKMPDANEVISVPNASLVEEMGTYFVYVQLKAGLYEKRPVTIGATDGLRTEIISGLKGNEQIVSKGAIYLKLAQASGGIDAHSGHVH